MKQSIAGQLAKFYEAAYLDLPLAMAPRWIGGQTQSPARAGWAAYDSFVALANEITNQIYANRVVASSFGRILETAFQMQHLLDALAPGIPATLLAPVSREPIASPVADGIGEAAARITLGSREAAYTEAAAEYRTAALVRRPRRAAA